MKSYPFDSIRQTADVFAAKTDHIEGDQVAPAIRLVKLKG